MKNSSTNQEPSPSELISRRIDELGDWRGDALRRIRALIKQAVPEVVEEWKWRGTPVWSHNGIICTGESYKSIVKLTFAKGAFVQDPGGLFNASLDGNLRRAIDIHEGEEIDESSFKALVCGAAALNVRGKTQPKVKKTSSASGKSGSTSAKPESANTKSGSASKKSAAARKKPKS